jgi:hypothetical protein
MALHPIEFRGALYLLAISPLSDALKVMSDE